MIAAFTFAGAVAVTRYVSLGSVLVVIELMAGVLIYGVQGRWGLSQGHLLELYGITAFLTVMALWRHRENIRRLLAGTERKIGEKAE